VLCARVSKPCLPLLMLSISMMTSCHHQGTPCQPGSLCQSNNSTLVPKQHHQTLEEHCSPPGPVPDVAPQHTRDKDNSSKWLLKDRLTHAALQFPNQTTAVGYPRTCGQQVARLPQTSTRRSTRKGVVVTGAEMGVLCVIPDNRLPCLCCPWRTRRAAQQGKDGGVLFEYNK
jgi:hypothetical protein